MTIYRFSDASMISEVAISSDVDRTPTALVTANPAIPADRIANIRLEMESYGWQCVPATTAEGKDVLQVDGFQTQEEFIAFLKNHNFISGDPQVTEEERKRGEHSKKVNADAKEFFGRFSLPLAGVLNLIGDIGFLGSGLKTGDKYKITGGSLYTLGGMNLAVFGRNRTPVNRMGSVSQRMAEFFIKTTGTVPEDTALSKIEFKVEEDKLKGTGKFLYNNAANNTLTAYTAGAAAMTASGFQKMRAGKGNAGFFYGLSSLVFKISSLLIPEKKDDEADKEKAEGTQKSKEIIGRAVDWVREKPLRVFGYGSLITDSLLAIDTLQDYRRDPKGKSYLYTGLTTITYMFADVMAAISNKNTDNAGTKFDVDEQRRVEALAAEAIARQPGEKQDELVDQVAGFLSTQPEMRGKRPDIVSSIKQQVQHMKDNPWAVRVMESAAAATVEQNR